MRTMQRITGIAIACLGFNLLGGFTITNPGEQLVGLWQSADNDLRIEMPCAHRFAIGAHSVSAHTPTPFATFPLLHPGK